MKIKTYIKFPLTITLMMVILTSVALGMTLKDNPKSRSGKIMEKSLQGGYSTYSSFADMLNATDARYFIPVRISPAGSKNNPTYHGFFFYNCSQNELYQFDPSGRYMLGMRVFIEDREVLPEDKGEIGIFDLQNNNKWIKIGETNAWNYQQGCRLQWIPGSFEEIIWNDRSATGRNLKAGFIIPGPKHEHFQYPFTLSPRMGRRRYQLILNELYTKRDVIMQVLEIHMKINGLPMMWGFGKWI